MIPLTSIGQEKRILNRVRNSSIISTIRMYPSMSTITTNDSSFLDNSSTFIKDFSNLQQTSSTSQYHSQIVYSNNSFHMYDHLITNNNIYNGKKCY